MIRLRDLKEEEVDLVGVFHSDSLPGSLASPVPYKALKTVASHAVTALHSTPKKPSRTAVGEAKGTPHNTPIKSPSVSLD